MGFAAQFEATQLGALFAALIPAGGVLPGLADRDLGEFMSRFGETAHPLLRFGVRASTWALAVTPVFTLGKWSTFADLSVSDRERVLERVKDSRVYVLRQMVSTLKLVACLAYFDDPGIQERARGGR